MSSLVCNIITLQGRIDHLYLYYFTFILKLQAWIGNKNRTKARGQRLKTDRPSMYQAFIASYKNTGTYNSLSYYLKYSTITAWGYKVILVCLWSGCINGLSTCTYSKHV